MLRWLILSLFLASQVAAAFVSKNSLQAIAPSIKHTIESEKEQSNALLAQLVNINSQTENIAGVRQVGDILAAQLRELGFTTYWEKLPADMKRAGNLFAVHPGQGGKRLLLIGHLDTVFPGDPAHPFKRLPDERAFGIGSADMKGGDVTIIQALRALHANHLLSNASIVVAFIGDEESAGRPISISRRELMKHAKQSDVLLDFESGPVSLGRRGISKWALTTRGTQQHSSIIFQPEVGNGAIFEVARMLREFEYELSHTKNLTVNPSIVLGGSTLAFNEETNQGTVSGKHNVVAKEALALGDLRYISDTQKRETEQKMQHIVEKYATKHPARIVFNDLMPPMPPMPGNVELLSLMKRINHLVTNQPLEILAPGLRGGGDISHIAHLAPAGLVGLGPVGAEEHTLNETIDLRSMHLASLRAALLIYALTR